MSDAIRPEQPLVFGQADDVKRTDDSNQGAECDPETSGSTELTHEDGDAFFDMEGEGGE